MKKLLLSLCLVSSAFAQMSLKGGSGGGVASSVAISDGVTTASNIAGDTGQNAVLVAGSRKEVTFTATSGAQGPVASTDVSNYRWVSVHIVSQGTGSAVLFEGSNDNTTWTSFTLSSVNFAAALSTQTSNAASMWHGSLSCRYFRLRVTGISAGTTAGVVEFFSNPGAFGSVQSTVAGPSTEGSTLSGNPVRIGGSDGTNVRTIKTDTSGNVLTMPVNQEVSFSQVASGTVASTDVSNYRWVSVQITSAGTGGATNFQVSNDNTNWNVVSLMSVFSIGSPAQTGTSGTAHFAGPINARYFRLNVTHSSGTTAGVVEFSSMPSSLVTSGAVAYGPTADGAALSGNPLRIGGSDGTNIRTIKTDSSGNVAMTGAFTEVSFTTTTVQAVASTDVSNYKWAGIHIVNQGTNSVVAFQGSNDNTNWVPVNFAQSNAAGSNNATSSTGSAGIIYWGPISYRYFRLNITGISGGTTSGVIEFYTQAAGSLNTLQNVSLATTTGGGDTVVKVISAATTNATSVKASGGQVYSVSAFNTNASSPRYLKMYNKLSAPTVGTDTPVAVYLIPAGGSPLVIESTNGHAYNVGIAFAITGGMADTDTTAIAASEVVVNIGYK